MEVPGRHGGDAGGKGKQSEIGGFYFFPPGHPDYVPLPPGEAALIAGRQVRTVCVAEPYAAMSIVCMYVYIYIISSALCEYSPTMRRRTCTRRSGLRRTGRTWCSSRRRAPRSAPRLALACLNRPLLLCA
jgi:hypothetical protein